MLTSKVIQLYQDLDFLRETDTVSSDPVQLFHHVEGADHTYELVWTLASEPTQDEYGKFSQLLAGC